MWNALPVSAPVPGSWPALDMLPCWLGLLVVVLTVLGTVVLLVRVDQTRGVCRRAAPDSLRPTRRRLGGSAAA
jgi:hypothetical protein